MVLVIARALARPDGRADLVALLVAAARRAREEQGCRSYAFHADLEEPNALVSVEEWDTRADLDRHMGTPELADLLAALSPLLAAPPTITVHEVSASGPYGG